MSASKKSAKLQTSRHKHLLRPALVTIALAMTTVSMFGQSELGRQIEHQISGRFEFHVRKNFGLSPPLDPRLKVFGYDDAAVAATGRAELTPVEWANLLTAMAARQPRIIVIDKVFAFLPEDDLAGIEKLRSTLNSIPVVAIGSFLHHANIPKRQPLDLERMDFRLNSEPASDDDAASAPELFAYGPHAAIKDAFAHIGHLLYPGAGRIQPLIKVNSKVAIPHTAMYTAKSLDLHSDGLRLDGTALPLDTRGSLPVNFVDPESLYKKTYSLRATFELINRGQPLHWINAGDSVLILPLLYTGNIDVLDTPVGRIPGGFIIASLMNSILRSEWLTPVNLLLPATLAAAVLGCSMGALLNPALFWPIFVSSLALASCGSLLAFSYLGLLLPWFYPFLTLAISGLSLHALNIRTFAAEMRRLRLTLKGSLPESKIQAIARGEGKLQHEASEHVVTLMFLDIANFSIIAQQKSPKEVFHNLKNLLGAVTKLVHKYGGTVDKTLGDGLLAFFGYSYDGEVTENQADQAIRCAIEIQKQNLTRCLDAAEQGSSVLPFRIGINTGAVYIGDLGSEERIDFTVIGSGVNFAQRLESACEQHKIMLSATTMDFSVAFSPKMPGFKRRYIHVKHHQELLEAIELNPFHDAPEMQEQALRLSRKSSNAERKEQRWPVLDKSRLQINSEFGPANLVDFSASGMGISLKSYLAQGVSFDFTLSSPDPEITRLINALEFTSIRAEVRWGKPGDGVFTHGLKYLNLGDYQLNRLMELLRQVHARQRAS